MEKEFSIILKENIKYKTKKPIQVPELVQSLQALEKVVEQSKGAFSTLTNANITDVQLFIEEIEEGSILQKIAIKLIFGSEEEFEKFLENTHKWIKENPVKSAATGLVGLVIGGLITYGISSSDKSSIAISQNYGNIILHSSVQLGIEEKDFKDAIENSPTNKKSLVTNSVKFAQVAKEDGRNAEIIFGDENGNKGTDIKITSEAIKDLPEQVKIESIEKSTELDNITLNIRSMDLDKYNNGWSGYIDGVMTKRVKLEIPLTMDLKILAKQVVIKADVTLISSQKGEHLEHKKIILRKIHTK